MKKILIIGLSPILGGVETYLYNLVKKIDKDMYKFDFLIIGNEKSVFQDEINSLIGDGKNHFFYSPNIKEHYFTGKRWLKKFYDENQFDLIYLNTCTAARIKYCEYSIKKCGTQLISHSHSSNATKFIHIVSNGIYKNKITKMSNVRLGCSNVAYDWLFTDSAKENSIVPNGVDLDRFRFNIDWRNRIRQSLEVGENEIIVGNVGRLSQVKNQNFFIELSKKLPNNYKFLILGDGELKENLEKRIKEENLCNRFFVLPAKKNIEEYYSAMDIYAMPSLFEGLPISAMEAQAEGLPCIFSTNVTRETGLSDKAFFLDLEDVDAWVRVIIENAGKRYDGSELVMKSGFSSTKPVEMIESIFKVV